MSKFRIRLVSVFLVPLFIADPTTSSALAAAPSLCPHYFEHIQVNFEYDALSLASVSSRVHNLLKSPFPFWTSSIRAPKPEIDLGAWNRRPQAFSMGDDNIVGDMASQSHWALGSILLRQWLLAFEPEIREPLEKTIMAVVGYATGKPEAVGLIAPQALLDREHPVASVPDSDLEAFIGLLQNDALSTDVIRSTMRAGRVSEFDELSRSATGIERKPRLLSLINRIQSLALDRETRASAFDRQQMDTRYTGIYQLFDQVLPHIKHQLDGGMLSKVEMIRKPAKDSLIKQILGESLDPAIKTPRTFVMFDMDKIKKHNDAFGKFEITETQLKRFGELLDKAFPATAHARVGGDEFFVCVPEDAERSIQMVRDLEVAFVNENPHLGYLPVTFSAGLVTVQQLLDERPEFKRTTDPMARFNIARELSSKAMTLAKEVEVLYPIEGEQLKNKVVLYRPPSLLKGLIELFSSRYRKSLSSIAHESSPIKKLLEKNDVNAPIELPALYGRRGSKIVEFAEHNDFREELAKKLAEQGHKGYFVLGSVQATYGLAKDPLEVILKSMKSDSRLLGNPKQPETLRVSGKAFNTLDSSNKAFDEIILMLRMLEYQHFANVFVNLPMEWQGELWFVRGPDTVFYAILPAETSTLLAESRDHINRQIHHMKYLFEQAIHLTQGELNGDFDQNPILNDYVSAELNQVVKVVDASNPKALPDAFRDLDIQHTAFRDEIGRVGKETPDSRRHFAMWGLGEGPNQEDVDTANTINDFLQSSALEELRIKPASEVPRAAPPKKAGLLVPRAA
jgi:GGDEF domain-containing protein